ncbi:hypothetical protein BDU57DRAFT_545792 [Ampelomyces quisqualis]|uniref:Secreted protein n=1 Tax=Ampelomyces quisqualis TaxID=50730 RepID=A0A6A5QYY7_AMPQU|nr:hypothetical protein BDU57DRAFT_545792 [Ampelomyces quisqualis]
MVTLCITQVITIALLAFHARPSHALWDVYSTFIDGRTWDPQDAKRNVGKQDCFAPKKLNENTHIKFSKNWASTANWAKGPYCMHYFSDEAKCKADKHADGDDMWQYQNILLTGKPYLENMYGYPVSKSDPDRKVNWAAFKWTLGKCPNSSKIIDEKNGDFA